MTTRIHRRRGAFTLIELLVVIGIIVLLVGILTPMVMSSRRNAERMRAQQDLNTISIALEEYKKDFKDYPRPNPARPVEGILAWALLGPWPANDTGGKPFDGADGFGFRTQWDDAKKVGGKVWGPYLPPEKFQFEDKANPYHIVDRLGNRIEYFPRIRGAKPTTPLFGVNGGDPLKLTVPADQSVPGSGLGVYDCRNTTNKEAIYYLQRAMGDGTPRGSSPPTYPHDDLITGPDETKLLTDYPPFILMTRGYRKTFSPQQQVDSDFASTSEVTNLQTP